MKISLAFAIILVLCSFSACYKDKFEEDPDNRGISVFTNQKLAVMSFYLDGKPWVRYFSPHDGEAGSQLTLVQTTGPRDSIYIAWYGALRETSIDQRFVIGISVKKGFTLRDLYGFSGHRFPDDSTAVQMGLPSDNSNPVAANSSGRLYITGIEPISGDSSYFNMYGLFDGMIGDTLIEKGRFDYSYSRGGHNLP